MDGGIASAAFWGFVAVVVVAGIWREVATRRETEMTIRLAIEKGQQLDPLLIEKMLRPRKKTGSEGLLIAGGVILAAGIGLPILGYFVSLSGEHSAFYPLVGVGILTGLVGIAFLILSGLVRTRRAEAER